MNLEELTREDLVEVSKRLMQGESMEQIESELIPGPLKDLVNSVHSILCQSEHGEGFGCSYHEDKDFHTGNKKEWLASVEMIESYYSQAVFSRALGAVARAILVLHNTVLCKDSISDEPVDSKMARQAAWQLLELSVSTIHNPLHQASSPTLALDSSAPSLTDRVESESGSGA